MSERAAQSNLEIIWADWVDAIRRGDIERLATRITATTVHRGIRPEFLCENGAAVIENARVSSENLPQVHAIELVECDDHVVLGLRAPNVTPDNDDQVFIVFTLRDGLIVEIRDYLARRDAFLAAGETEPPDWR